MVGLLPSLPLHRITVFVYSPAQKARGNMSGEGCVPEQPRLERGMLWPAAGSPAARHEEQPAAVLRLSNHRNKDNIHNWSQAGFH